MIAILLGSFFSTGFYQYYSRHDAQVKKTTLKTKVANTKCRLSATILMHPAGLSWFKITVLCEKHASETQDAQVKKSLGQYDIAEIYETDYNCVTHLIRLLGLVHRLVLGHLHGNFQVKLHL